MMGDAFHGEKKTPGVFWRIVIGAVVGLAVSAILYPVCTPARIGHGPALCISKLKRLSTSQLIYASDYEDSLPPYYSFEGPEARDAFVQATYVYSKDGLSYVCPKSPEAKSESQRSKPKLGYEHFVLLLRLRGAKGVIDLRATDSLTKAAWMHDPIVRLEPKGDGEHIETYHGPGKSGFFVSFLDGHVKWIPTIAEQDREWMNTLGIWQK